jgi:malonyl-CoA O-methyltransferase
LDEVAARRWLEGRVPNALGADAWLHGEVARRMESRLQWMRQAPSHWVDWSPSLGGWEAADLLMQRYPQARLQRVETAAARLVVAQQRLAPPRWQFWKTPPELLARAEPGQARMVWANMQLHAHPQPEVLLQQWHAALAVDGFVMFSCLGPDSLREIRALYAHLGWAPPAHAFTDMHDWGDMLVQAGFAEPVMDMERITLTYADAEVLLADLRALGRNLSPARHTGCRGRTWAQQLRAQLSCDDSPLRGAPDGRLSLTFEVIYGHALKPTPRARVAPQTAVPLQDLKAMLGQRPARD